MQKATESYGFVGIDVAKNKLDVHIRPSEERFTFANSSSGLTELVALLKARHPKRVVFESTGGYGLKLLRALEAAGVEAHCVPAQRIRKFAEAIGIKAKTDALDAEVIARFAETAKLVDKVKVSLAARALRQLVVRRMQIVGLRAKEKAHKESLPEELEKSWVEIQSALDTHVSDLDEEIIRAVNADPELLARASVLATIKGVGLATCAALLALLPELGQMSGKQVASLVGVAPFNDQSADSDKRRKISGGRRRVRCALYMATVNARAHEPAIEAIYTRLIQRGKLERVAMIAAVRKLIVIANARMRDAFFPKSVTAAQPSSPLTETPAAEAVMPSAASPPKAWKPRKTGAPHKKKAPKRAKKAAARATRKRPVRDAALSNAQRT